MKTLTFLFLFSFVVGFAQAQDNQKQEPVKVKEVPETGCIIWPVEPPKTVPHIFDADEYYRHQIVQPFYVQDEASKQDPCHYRSFTKGVLDEDLPFVNTLTGTVFTFDYLRNSVR